MASERSYLPRAIESVLRERLSEFPVVTVIGARQTGKSTLSRFIADPTRLYLTLDDLDALEQAEEAPREFLRRARRMTVDEVQRSPDLLLTIKQEVDRERTPGQFLLTGSANLLLMQRVSESLAGRAAYLTLWPLTAAEQDGRGRAGRWQIFFEEEPGDWLEAVSDLDVEVVENWKALARRGGYPVPAYQMSKGSAAAAWFDGYVGTYLERDLRSLSAVESLPDFRRLMRAACLRVGNILNQADLARDVGIPPTTAQRYLDLMETSFQLIKLEAFAVNRTKRLTKRPKIYWSDTGLAMHLASETEPRGAHLENLVLSDLLAWREGRPHRPQLLYWRTTKGTEVDFVVEWQNRVLPIEVKSGDRVRAKDTRPLQVFLEEYADLAEGGLVLYDGEDIYWAAERVLAVPWRRIL